MAKRCRVTFIRSRTVSGREVWSALLWSGKRVVNAMNYPHGATLSTAEKRRARAQLCAGLAELGGARRRR